MALTLEEHKLRMLRERYATTLAWFSTKTGCVVTAGLPDPRTSAFAMTATWEGGEYTKRFDAAVVRGLGRRGCAMFFAEEFVREVLRAKGEDAE